MDRRGSPGSDGRPEPSAGSVEALSAAILSVRVPLVFLDGRGTVLFGNAAALAHLGGEAEPDWAGLLAAWSEGVGPLRTTVARLAVRIVALVPAGEPDGSALYVVLPADADGGERDPLLGYRLTASEREVLAELIDGGTPQEIARRHGVSIATVRTHIARLHDKFGVGRTIDVIRLALKAAREAAY